MKLKNILSLLLITLSVVSCGYLDFDETNNLKTKEDIYSYFDRTKQMLTTVYGYMPQDFGTVAGAMRDCGSDDALFANTGGKVQAFNNGTWSSIKTVDSSWNSLYSGIRAANEFIYSVAEVDLSRYEYTGGYKNWMKQMAFFPYEARVLRAFYFFELARRYGDIAMPLKQLTVDEANNLEKTPFSNVIHFIVSESTEAAAILPVTYVGQPNSEVGRITKGFALALKSKALLYAASRLHNPSMDQTKWKASAKAALELINLANTGIYQLDPGDKANNLSSKEVILFRMNGANSDFEKNNFPLRFVEGSRSLAGNYPTQNLVDAFETQNGYQVALTVNGWISEDPDFNLQQPYSNRDPRFYKTVLANGMSFKGSRIELFKEGADDVSISQGGTPTGYFLRKYVNETTNFTPNAIVKNKHHWVIYRYAETLLTYAESMIEAFDDPNYKDEVYILSALDALNAIRNNASMPAITEINKQAFIETLRHEWRVEFAFEDHRFWDVRRWGIAENTQKEIYGVLIEKLEDKELLFARKSCETRKWANRMSLYPIPQEELFTNKKLNPQNAGW